jgi:hypothetical protein
VHAKVFYQKGVQQGRKPAAFQISGVLSRIVRSRRVWQLPIRKPVHGLGPRACHPF